jgi:hypothetical protein
MAARYQHLSSAFLSEAVAKLDEVFVSLNRPDLAENREERHPSVTAKLTLGDGTDVGVWEC